MTFNVLADPNQAGIPIDIPIVVFYFISGLVPCPFPELRQGIATESELGGMGPPHADLFQPSSGFPIFLSLNNSQFPTCIFPIMGLTLLVCGNNLGTGGEEQENNKSQDVQ